MRSPSLLWVVSAVALTLAPSCAPPRDSAPPAASTAEAAPATTTASLAATPSPAAPSPPAQPAPPAELELPGGGRTIFPDHLLVGFCGTPGAPALGPLLDHPATKAEKLLGYASQYATKRKVLPVFELIAVVVEGYAGNDGKYRARVYDSVVDEYLRVARENKGLLILNIQPGQSDFLTEVHRFDSYLREPDVGVALDPEWAMLPKQTPNKFYGQTTGDAVNGVIAYLSSVVAKYHLPEKALVFHQMNGYVVKDEGTIAPAPGVAVIKSVDGWGPKGTKLNTYHYLMRFAAPGVHAGFKLFFDEDRHNGGVLMTPGEVLALVPPPEYVMYE
jgi:hypothetical protein